MQAEAPQPLPNPTRVLLDQLVQEKGLRAGDYAFFFVTGEGEYLPDSSSTARRVGEQQEEYVLRALRGPSPPVEETSGCVINRDGRVYSFWLGWDAEQGRPTLTIWEPE